MKTSNLFQLVAVSFALLPSLTVAADVPSVLGRTVKMNYKMLQCGSDRPTFLEGSCQEPLDLSVNVFVTMKGHVFDFSTSDTGDEYDLGVTNHGTTVNAEGNTLTFAKGDLVEIITLRADTCDVSIKRRGGVVVTILSQSCTVVEGPSPR